MNQWNRLKVQIIKKRRVRCDSFELPLSLKSSSQLSLPNGRERGNSAVSQTTSSVITSHLSSVGESGSDSSASIKNDFSFDSKTTGAEKSFNSSSDDVFGDFLETSTTNERFLKRKRYFSLPTCLNSETEDRPLDFQGVFRVRSVAHEMSGRIPGGSDQSEACWSTEFPRSSGGSRSIENMHNEMKSSRTSHAGQMVGQDKRRAPQLIKEDNKDTSSRRKSGEFAVNLVRSWRSDTDLRSEWDHKVLDYTSHTVFGAERLGGPSRSRSVTLTEGVHNEVARIEDRKTREQKERVKSESKQTMPKFQNVLWDYVKRRSSKRKENQVADEDSRRNGAVEGDVEYTKKTTDYDKGRSRSGGSSNSVSFPNSVSSTNNNSSLDCSNSSSNYRLSKSRSTSDPSLRSPPYSTQSTTKPARPAMMTAHRRSCSWDEVQSQSQTKISLEEFKDNPGILKLMLTSESERRPMEERLKTLTFSREWLLKELKGLRDNDRTLARQFINLRSAILEVKKAREKEESDYDSEGEGFKTKTVDARRLELQKEGNGTDTEYHLHITPARNILSYC